THGASSSRGRRRPAPTTRSASSAEPHANPDYPTEVPMSASAPALAPPRPRAGLALLLAVLGVPGVTIAWDLPAGGYWIGIPLAVAAIVVGVRSHQASPRIATSAIVLAAIEVLFTLTWTMAG